MEKSDKHGFPRTSVYLALKTFKLISAIILLLVYKLAGGTEFIVFSLLLIIYYWANLILDTMFFVNFEKKYKK